jgi:dTMP kinase
VPDPGLFLTFEGVDGAGKSTHIATVVKHLEHLGVSVVQTREPGGTPLGEKLRELLLTESMHLETETLLMFAARNEHIKTVIEPALAKGQWVVCDRFTDATFAYQGAGRRLGAERVAILESWVHPDLQPDRTWLFDVPLSVARERLDRTRELDRFEREGSAFFERTRQGYADRMQQNPARFDVIDGSQTIESIQSYLQSELDKLVAMWREAA